MSWLLPTEAACNFAMDMLRSSCCNVLRRLSALWLWIQDLSGYSYYVLNCAFHMLFSDICSINQYYLACSFRETAVLRGEGLGGFVDWEERMSFNVRVLCLPLVVWFDGLHQNLVLHLHSQWRLHLSKICAFKALKNSKGNYCKYYIVVNEVSNLLGKGFLSLAGPFVILFYFLESHKRNSAVTKANSKILVIWRVGERKEGWSSSNILHTL